MLKIFLIIIDGLGDEPIPQLGNKTPLEAAKTPNLDFLAKNGICGQVVPFLFPHEKEPTSEGTHVALFGYQDYFLNRGPYEATGIVMKIKEGDVALRVNFGTVNEDLVIIDRRAGRITNTKPLVKVLKKIKIPRVKFLIKKSFGHRAVLILRHPCSSPGDEQLSEKISDSDPKKIGLRVKKILPLDKSQEAKFTAEVLNKFLEKAHQILENHPLNKKRVKKGLLPANYLLVRGAGLFRKMPNFKERYGLKACCIAGGGLYKGIAKILGMDLIKVKGANALPTTNLKVKFLAAKNALRKYNFIFLHIKAADNLAEDGKFLEKMKFIEKIDKNLKPILSLKDTLIIVTADHSTCSLLKRHCKRSIPILIYGSGRDSVKEFSERTCEKGKLGKIKQIDLMKRILELFKS